MRNMIPESERITAIMQWKTHFRITPHFAPMPTFLAVGRAYSFPFLRNPEKTTPVWTPDRGGHRTRDQKRARAKERGVLSRGTPNAAADDAGLGTPARGKVRGETEP